MIVTGAGGGSDGRRQSLGSTPSALVDAARPAPKAGAPDFAVRQVRLMDYWIVRAGVVVSEPDTEQPPERTWVERPITVSCCGGFAEILVATALGPHAPVSVPTATLLSDRLVPERTCPVQGSPCAITPAHNVLPLNFTDEIETVPVPLMLPAMLAVQPTAIPDLVNVVEPVKLIGPAGETVTANASGQAATNNANAALTGMSLKLFIWKTSL